jgi:hypothetical protein
MLDAETMACEVPISERAQRFIDECPVENFGTVSFDGVNVWTNWPVKQLIRDLAAALERSAAPAAEAKPVAGEPPAAAPAPSGFVMVPQKFTDAVKLMLGELARTGTCPDRFYWAVADNMVIAAAPQQPSAVNEAERDAARYRWLRENLLSASWQSGLHGSGRTNYCPVDGGTGERWDTAIDAAMKASAPAVPSTESKR